MPNPNYRPKSRVFDMGVEDEVVADDDGNA
jgi:hypothetical protein